MRVHPTSVLLLLAACSTANITPSWQFDEEYDFAQLQTFALFPSAPDGLLDAWTLAVANTVIRETLQEKGYHHVPEGEVDFKVLVHGAMESRLQNYGTYTPIRMGRGSNYNNPWMGPSSGTIHYREGALTISMVDERQLRQVWRGVGSGVIDPNATQDSSEKRVRAAVAELLAEFPRSAAAAPGTPAPAGTAAPTRAGDPEPAAR